MTSQLARHIFLILSPVSSSWENLFVFCDIGPWEHGALFSRHGKGRRSDIVCNVSKPSHGEILCCWISAADIKRESRFASSSDSYNFGHVWQKKKKTSVHFSKICPEYIGVIYMLIISEQYDPQLGSTEGWSWFGLKQELKWLVDLLIGWSTETEFNYFWS